MSDTLVHSAQSGGVRTLTLNRPAALNSFTAPMLERLLRLLVEAADDATVRCVLLTGAGRAFCAGQDLTDPRVAPGPAGATPKDLGRMIEEYYTPLVLQLRVMPVPVVAAVNGVAAGAGANLALACDLVIASESAAFIEPFAKIGLVPDTAGTWLLPRLVGRARALGIALLGEKLAAADAVQCGLIWKCVEDGKLLEQAEVIAQRLASLPVKALVATRRAFDRAQVLDLSEALTEEVRQQRELGFAHDYQEGVSAFVAKRAPTFTDR